MSENFGIKALWIGLIGVLLAVVGSTAFVVIPKLHSMKSEYVTADVIRAADRFVTAHPGRWPQSWQDLGGEDLSRYTDFRFDLKRRMIVRDRQLIYGAIQPKGHRYRTYPHAREQLDALYEKLASARVPDWYDR